MSRIATLQAAFLFCNCSISKRENFLKVIIIILKKKKIINLGKLPPLCLCFQNSVKQSAKKPSEANRKRPCSLHANDCYLGGEVGESQRKNICVCIYKYICMYTRIYVVSLSPPPTTWGQWIGLPLDGHLLQPNFRQVGCFQRYTQYF